MNFRYFGEFFSGILVYHYPPWPTLISVVSLKICHENGLLEEH